MLRKTPLFVSVFAMSVALALAVPCRADDEAKDQKDPAQSLPGPVMEAAYYHVPDLTIDDVSLRQVKGHPTVYVIDGQCCDRSVVLAIEESGDVHEIRFHKHNGVKPEKISHSAEELPDAVRETAERVVPNVEIIDIKSTAADGEERIYHLIGTLTQDEMECHVQLTIEADGDILECRVIKPIKAVASVDVDTPPERNPDDD